MWRRYRETDDKKAPWECVPESQIDQVDTAYHMTMLAVDVPNDEGASYENAKYWGDMVIDIDCGAGDDPTPEQIDEAIKRAVTSAQLVAEYIALRSRPDHFQIYASGKKGFHIHIPAKLMHVKKAPIRHLNLIYKAIAKRIEVDTGAEGIDFQLYVGNRGHMVRVPNKLRKDGGYKVQVSYDELMMMTPERYREYTSHPRQALVLPNLVTNLRMVAMVDDARAEVEAQLTEKAKNPGSVPDELLEGFGTDDHPECVKLLGDSRRHRDTTPYHQMAHQMAIYLRASNASDGEAHKLASALAEASHSSKYPDVDKRRRHVLLDILPYVKDKKVEFSCAAMHSVVDVKNACHSCPINAKTQEYIAANTGVQRDEFGLYAITEDGARRQLTNFHIDIDYVVIPLDHKGKLYDTWDSAVFSVSQGDVTLMTKEFNRECLSDAKTFTSAFDELRNGRITVTNNDVRDIRNYLMAQIQGKEGMKLTEAIGIRKVTSINAETEEEHEEFFWVEEGWSWKADGTLGMVRLSNPVENAVKFARRPQQMTILKEQDKTLLSLLSCTEPEIVGVLLGWVGAAQLKEHTFDRIREFPLLNLYGPAGSGKTSMARIFSALGAADYRNAPQNVATDTPYPIRQAAWTSTTVPRIFDECNKVKMPFQKWAIVREVLKCCYQQSTMSTGALKDRKTVQAGASGVTTTIKTATSPIIYISTSRNDEQEIIERSICLWVKKSAHTNPGYAENFTAVNSNPEAWEHLFELSRIIVKAALKSKSGELYDRFNEILKGIECPQQRTKKSLAYLLWGLEFLTQTFKSHEASEAVLAKMEEITAAVVEWSAAYTEYEAQNSRSEIDNYFDKLNHAIARIDNNGNPGLRAGVHYLRAGNVLYIDGIGTFNEYRAICRFLGTAAEFSSHRYVIDAMRGNDYYLGEERIPDGKGLALEWTKVDIKYLESRGHDFSRFVEI